MAESTSKPREISLRPFEISDVDDFLTWTSDENVTRYCRWNAYTNRDDALDFLRQVIESHPWYRAICVDDRPIGSIFVLPGTSEKDQRKGEIGYALNAKYWGQGIATKAVNLAISQVFKDSDMCLDRVEGFVLPENKASQRVLEKAGFVREGLLRKFVFFKGQSRDIVVYSIINKDNN